MYCTPGIRLAFSVDYSAPDDEKYLDRKVLKQLETTTCRKRKAADFGHDARILKRRRVRSANIRTDFLRSASLPAQNVMEKTTQGPHAEAIRGWMDEIPDSAAPIDGTDQHADPTASIRNQMLEAFARHGVPVETATDSLFANIANAVAEILTKSVAYAQSVNEMTSANTQYLVQENQNLRGQLNHIGSALAALDEKYHKFVKRSSQKEIEKTLKEFHQKVDKLRVPDVTLEGMARQIKGFERAQFKQNETIDRFKARCEKELENVSTVRRKFNREARDQTANRKDDLKDLKVGIASLEERLETLETQWIEAQGTPNAVDQRIDLSTMDVSNLREDVQILRQHVATMADDDRRKWMEQATANRWLSKTITDVYKYTFGDV